MFEKERKIKKLGEPLWKTKPLHWSRIWIRIVPLDATMGSRSSLEQLLVTNRLKSMYKALLKPREWLPKGTLQCQSARARTPLAHLRCSRAHEGTRTSPLHSGIWAQPCQGCPALALLGAHRVGSQGEGAEVPCQRMASWEYSFSSPLFKGRMLPAGSEPSSWVMETGPQWEENQGLGHKLQKYRRAVDDWAVGRWDQSLPDSRRLLPPRQWERN